jgi:hypothetical protein
MSRLTRIGICSLVALAVPLFAPGEVQAAVKCASPPAAVRGTAGRTDVFVVGSDKQIYHYRHAGKTGKWTSLGGSCQYGAGAAAGPTGRLDVFTVAKSGHLVQKTHTEGWSKEWKDLGQTPGGKCSSAPVAVANEAGHLTVFVLGADKKVYQYTPGTKAGAWTSLGGSCQYGVGAAAGPAGRLDVFTVAKDGHLVQKTFTKAWGKEWHDLGIPPDKKCSSAPAATERGARVDVFVLGSAKFSLGMEMPMFQAKYDGKSWQWISLGGNCRYGVGVTATASGRLNVFTVAKSGHLVRKSYTKAWDKEWRDLGMPAE